MPLPPARLTLFAAFAPWLALAAGGCSESTVLLPDAPDMAVVMTERPPDMLCTLTLCGDRCIDVRTDPLHCGDCNTICGQSQDCRDGACVDRPCAADADCDDRIGCTVDQCAAGKCSHAAGVCPMGMVCDVAKGCVPGAPPVVGPGLCFTDPPKGATLAPAPPKYKGTCPMMIPATMGANTIMSSGNARNFLLAVPKNLDPKEKLPVIFLWHWLGGSANGFYTKGDVQKAVDQQRFLAVMPDNKKVNGNSDLLWKWPFAVSDPQGRVDEEVRFFDDMYACVAAQFNINKECVATGGVSAGALWTDQLVQLRNDVFSSGISLSGGTGGLVKAWNHPPRRVPMVVLWGGPSDFCVAINFQDASRDLEKGLKADGSFVVECQHNCGHGVPPIEPPQGLSTFSSIWQFAFDHPYWLGTGDSPYKKTGLPTEYPPWCAIGAGQATPRTGMCDPPGC